MINLYIFNELSRAAVYGIGTYVRELTSTLKGSEINIYVIHLRSDKPDTEPEEIDGVHHWHIPAPINHNTSLDWNRQSELYYRSVVYLLQLQIKDTNRLVFHLNYMQNRIFLEELRRIFPCKVMFTIHYFNWCFSLLGNTTRYRALLAQQDSSSKDSTVKKEFLEEKEFFSLTDRIICLSEFTRDVMEKDYGIESNRLQVVYNGLTDGDHTRACEDLLRKRYRFSEKVPVILFAGRLDKIKGLEYVLQAFRIVLNTHPDCHLCIAGNGSYDTYLKECEDIWMNITFTGRLEKSKLYDFYSIAHIGVMPSLHEQCSYVAIEMMMHGVPLIASTSTGLCEMVEDGVSGLHMPVMEYPDRIEMDTELLAEKMLYLLQHPAERKRMGANARKGYEQLYSSKVMREKMLSSYISLYDTEDNSSSMGWPKESSS